MRKRTILWGSLILAFLLVATSLVVHTSADSPSFEEKPSISIPSTLYGQVGVALNVTLDVTGEGYPLPDLQIVTPSDRGGINASISAPTRVGTSKFTAKLTISGTPSKRGKYLFGVKAQNSKGSDVEHLFIEVDGAVAVTGVSVSPTSPSAMPPGDSVYLTATLTPPNATNQIVMWKSDKPAVATVDASGLVTAVSTGNATITATTQDGNKTASVNISVPASVTPVPINSINVTPSTVNLSVGEAHTLNVRFNPVDATNQGVTWSSDAPGVVSVAADGTIVGLIPGEANITATSVANSGKTSSARVVVRERFVSVSDVSITPQTLTLYHPGTTTAYLSAQIIPPNASSQGVTWTSSDPSVVTVNANGLVTTTGAGSAEVTVTTADGGHSDTATITVKTESVTIPVSGVTLEPISVTLNSGDVRSLVATISPSNATNQNVTWNSSTSTVATIAADGTLTAISNGTTTITVTTGGGKTATCGVTVLAPSPRVVPTGVTLFPASANVEVSKDLLISYDVLPANAGNKVVTWTSNAPNIATVDSTGRVTGVATGSATITATAQDGGASAACAINVTGTSTAVPVTGVTVNPKTLTLKVDESAVVNALIAPGNAGNQQVDWASSHPLVASVAADGTVIGLSPGTATITVTTRDGSRTDTCSVTVTPKNVSVSGIALTTTSMNVSVGYSQTLTPVFSPTNATNKVLYWSTSNPAVATVDASGNVQCIGPGTAVVTVTTEDGGKQAFCTFNVVASGSVPVDYVQVFPMTWDMYTGDTKLLSALFFPTSATNKGLTWASSAPGVATVDGATGLVTAVGPGYARITATASDNSSKTSTAEIVVLTGSSTNQSVTDVDIIPPLMTNLAVGQVRKFAAQIVPSGAKNQKVYWVSSNPSVATVGSDGLVTIVGTGSVTITVRTDDGSRTESYSFTVGSGGGGGGGGGSAVSVVRIDLTQAKVALWKDQTFTLLYSIYPGNATDKKVVWTNSSPDIISFSTLSEDVGLGGIVAKAVNVGESLITVTTQDGQRSASCLFTVTHGDDFVPVESVSVSPSFFGIAIGQSRQLVATITPATATNKNVIWRSSHPEVAIVNPDGTVSGVSNGTATITAVAEDCARTSSATVTVGESSGGSSGCNSGFSLLSLIAALPLLMRKRIF